MTGMHQDEGASTVGVLDIPFLKTALPEKRRLLIACRARDPDRCIEEIGGFSVDTAGRFAGHPDGCQGIRIYPECGEL